MIGSVRGRIASKTPPQLMVDVGGVGYELEAPMSTYFHLPGVGEEVSLLTHLVVREDAHVLYAFGTEAERRLFRSLIKVSGVGPKIALALLSGISVEAFSRCIENEDIAALIKVPGIGRKTAERLIVEMRDRLKDPVFAIGAPPDGVLEADWRKTVSPESEAHDALLALGYRPAEATRLLKAIGPGTHSTEELIRRALQGAGSAG
jgi:holliday junction DNA helicase RuvA